MPGECLALEFSDSKLFLADISGPKAMSWEGILETVGADELAEMAGKADLPGLFNWGELPNMQQIWEGFARDILPKINGRAHTAVFDLSDCSGRSADSIRSALAVLQSFRPHMRVVLSANDNELMSIARALGCNETDHTALGRAAYESGNYILNIVYWNFLPKFYFSVLVNETIFTIFDTFGSFEPDAKYTIDLDLFIDE